MFSTSYVYYVSLIIKGLVLLSLLEPAHTLAEVDDYYQ